VINGEKGPKINETEGQRVRDKDKKNGDASSRNGPRR